jgi:hypothetical protein
LRFTEITYLPKQDQQAPQRLLYKTNIGFGLSITGEGESIGHLEKDATKTSFLRFWSNHPLSLIREGSGFWRYIPETENGVRFFTRYDYRTRFGTVGSWVDRLVFRPLMAWATAWSFDALRLWLERGIPPKSSLSRSVTEALCRFTLCLVWMYQGLIPKLFFPEAGELQMVREIGVFPGYETIVLASLGMFEVIFGLLFFLLGRSRRKALYIWNLLLLFFLALGALPAPAVFAGPFNPVTLNLGMMVLSAIGMLNLQDLPDASHCYWRIGPEVRK